MAVNNEYTKYEIIFRTVNKDSGDKTPLLDFSKESIRTYDKIQVDDSIMDFFPYCEVLVKDPVGYIADKINFSEGEVFNLKIGNEDEGYVNNNYAWSENQINEIALEKTLSGVNNFIMLSSHYAKDFEDTAVYTNKKLSQVADELASSVFGIKDSTKRIITNTAEDYKKNEISDYLYQLRETHSEFLKRISSFAYNKAENPSPFFCFINANGEFYFATIEDMFSKASIATYSLEFNEEMMIDPNSIKDWSLAFTGMADNKENYQKKAYITSKSGVSSSKILKLEDYTTLPSQINGANLIRKSFRNANIQSYDYFGIENGTVRDNPFFEGSYNGLFANSVISYRLPITISFNSKAVAGKKVTLKMQSAFEDKQRLTEYSTDWLIAESHLFIDGDGNPYQNLELVRPNIRIDSNHPLRQYFK
jgi:hypothetical protein